MVDSMTDPTIDPMTDQSIHTMAGKIESKIAFFDGISDKWDSWEDLAQLQTKLDAGLQKFQVGANETIADVGCGTGSLTIALLRRLGPAGRVIAVDISPRMIACACQKICDERVQFVVSSAEQFPLQNHSLDRVICFSVWPHFYNERQAVEQFWRALQPQGMLHVWHLISRQRVNEIHQSAAQAVQNDLLVPAEQLAMTLRTSGFNVLEQIDCRNEYLVSAQKPAV